MDPLGGPEGYVAKKRLGDHSELHENSHRTEQALDAGIDEAATATATMLQVLIDYQQLFSRGFGCKVLLLRTCYFLSAPPRGNA